MNNDIPISIRDWTVTQFVQFAEIVAVLADPSLKLTFERITFTYDAREEKWQVNINGKIYLVKADKLIVTIHCMICGKTKPASTSIEIEQGSYGQKDICGSCAKIIYTSVQKGKVPSEQESKRQSKKDSKVREAKQVVEGTEIA